MFSLVNPALIRPHSWGLRFICCLPALVISILLASLLVALPPSAPLHAAGCGSFKAHSAFYHFRYSLQWYALIGALIRRGSVSRCALHPAGREEEEKKREERRVWPQVISSPRLLYLVLSKNGAECLTSTQLHLENNLAAGYRSKCFTVWINKVVDTSLICGRPSSLCANCSLAVLKQWL